MKHFDRTIETPRRQQAVEKLLELGWVYHHEKGWIPNLTFKNRVEFALRDAGMGLDQAARIAELAAPEVECPPEVAASYEAGFKDGFAAMLTADDTKRLDWIEKNVRSAYVFGVSFDYSYASDDDPRGFRYLTRGHISKTKKTLREVIDAEITKEST